MHTSQQNGIVECFYRLIVERGVPLLLTICMPITLWPYAMLIVIFLINILPTKTLSGLSPFEGF